MVRAQARMETRLLLRNGEQLLLAVVIPLIVLVGGIAAAKHFDLATSHRPVDLLAPGVLALAVMSTSFTSLAISTGFERRYGVLKRLGSSPLPRSGLLAGKVGALLVVELLQLVVLGAAALAFGWDPQLSVPGVVGALVTALGGTAAFASLGLLVAGALRADGVTIVLTTHYMDEAERLADQVHVIDHGRLITSGSPFELTRAGGTSTIRLVVNEPFPPDAPASLQQALGPVTDVRALDDHSLLITGPADASTLATVSAWCERHGVLPESLSLGQRTLVDVFLQLTGRELVP
jgi:ABC-type transport system involved in cytochrome c biogenesis permease component